MVKPFEPLVGRETSATTFEWACGCIAHSFEGEMTVRACCIEHDDPLDDFVTATASEVMPNVDIERRWI